MSSEISVNLQRHNTRAPASVTHTVSAEATPAVLSIPKAEINFDPERMRQNLQAAIGQLNDMMLSSGRGLNFSMDEKLGRPIIYVKNSQTGEVVRQIPNEVVVRVAHGIEDLKGILLNENS